MQCSQIFAPQKKTRERGTGTINVDHLHPRGFNGYESVSSEDEHGEVLKDLTGVTVVSFAVLLRMLTQAKTAGAMEITLGSQLVLFLMKMKHGLTFAALGALFSVHRTIASRTFYAILDTLHSKTREWLSWLPKDAVQEAIPLSFREKYPTCRVIIDCTEVSIEKPPEVKEQVDCWSSWKSDFTLKFLVGVAPCGSVTFVSNAFGGRLSNAYITANCGLLELLEPNDLIMADKGFPNICSDLDACQVTLEVPPFACMNADFTASALEHTYKRA